MRSFTALLVAAALACVVAVPASARPADTGSPAVTHVRHAAPAAPVGDDGTAAWVYVLIGGGAILAFGTGGYLGARSVGRRLDPRAS
jgi:hypothetical protein